MNKGLPPLTLPHAHSADRPAGDRADRGALCARTVQGLGEQRGASLECARRWAPTHARAPSQAAMGRERTPSPGLGPAPLGRGDLTLGPEVGRRRPESRAVGRNAREEGRGGTPEASCRQGAAGRRARDRPRAPAWFSRVRPLEVFSLRFFKSHLLQCGEWSEEARDLGVEVEASRRI